MSKLFLVRHGEVEYQYDEQGRKLIYGQDIPLSIKGKKQIKELILSWRSKGIVPGRIYTSPYTRAYQTAAILTENLGQNIPIILEDELKDVHAPGWVGETMEYLQSIGGNIYDVPPRSADQETKSQVRQRIVQIVKKIWQENFDNENLVAIVSHGDPLRMLMGYFVEPQRETVNTRDELYLDKGQAWKLTLNPDFQLTAREIYPRLSGFRTEHKY